METAKKLLFVEDHSSFREGLSSLLKLRDGFEVVQAGTLEEARDRMGSVAPDAALVDLGLPGADGVEVIRELRRVDPEVPVLVLTVIFDDEWHDRAREAGAGRVLTKDAPLEEILAAVEEAMRG